MPDIENLCLIAEILGVSLDVLLSRSSENQKVMMGIDGGGTKTEFIMFNEDGGLTWSQPHEIEGFVTPNSTNVVVKIPQTEDILFVWNNEFAIDNGKRDPVTMAVSADNGISYKNIKNILEGNGSWQDIQFYGRSVLMQTGSNITIFDVSDIYSSLSGNKTVADLPKAATPTATYSDGWLKNVTNKMAYSLDGGMTWKFCGGTSVQIDDVAIDTETNNSLDPLTCKLMGLCLYAPGLRYSYIPVNHRDPVTKVRLSEQLTEEDIKTELQRIIDSGVKVIMHNGQFDYEVLKCTCDICVVPYWDTRLLCLLQMFLDDSSLTSP